jgi:hypothetical protein
MERFSEVYYGSAPKTTFVRSLNAHQAHPPRLSRDGQRLLNL